MPTRFGRKQRKAVSSCAAPNASARRRSCSSAMQQLNEEIGGSRGAAIRQKRRKSTLIERELAGVRDLYARQPGAVDASHPARARSGAARRRARATRRECGAGQGQDRRDQSCKSSRSTRICSSEVAKELRDIDGKIGEFVERKVTAEDQVAPHRYPRAADRRRRSSRRFTPSAASSPPAIRSC